MSNRTIGLSDALYEYTLAHSLREPEERLQELSLAHEVVMEAEAPFIEATPWRR